MPLSKIGRSTLLDLTNKFNEEGYLILPSYFSRSTIKKLNIEANNLLHSHIEKLERDEPASLSTSQKVGFLNLIPESRFPYWDPNIFCNSFLIKLLEQIFKSKDFVLPFYNINVNIPGTTNQFVHRDHGVSFKDFPIPLPTHEVVVNVPLIDFTEKNGSTEIWPGTHLIHDNIMEFSDNLNKRAKNKVSCRANMPAGSVLIRDLRLWHRGTPNRTRDTRMMLAMVYTRRFSRWGSPNFLDQKFVESLPRRAQDLLGATNIIKTKKSA